VCQNPTPPNRHPTFHAPTPKSDDSTEKYWSHVARPRLADVPLVSIAGRGTDVHETNSLATNTPKDASCQ